MPAKYFAGRSGYFTIDDFPERQFAMFNWSYVKDKGLVDISNTNAFGTEQYIGNLHAGSVTAEGYITDTLVDIINDVNGLQIGNEIVLNLYVDANTALGFTGINAVLDDITFDMPLDGAATFVLKAIISEPKL
jgi:hypothetical protein